MHAFVKHHKSLILLGLLAFTLRIITINWDNAIALHPDERMIMFVVERLSLHNLNPDFFSYGSLPIYLLAIAKTLVSVVDMSAAQYPNILYVGRFLSTLFDTGSTILIAMIGHKLFNRNIGLIAGFLYATAVFPIQNAHFFITDPQLSFWMLLTFWILVRKDSLSTKTFLLAGITAGLSAATKFSGIVTLGFPFLWLALNIKNLPTSKLRFLLTNGFVTTLGGVFAFFITQPYALINYAEYSSQVGSQIAMNSDASVFPYTIQFLHSIAYIDPLYGIIWWGLGIPLGIVSMVGVFFVIWKNRRTTTAQLTLFYLFYGIYFLVFGRSAVKFMRYYLPLYPLLILSAAVLIYSLNSLLHTHLPRWSKTSMVLLFGYLMMWPIMYLTALSGPNTRVVASDWIFKNLPAKSTIIYEAWDDALPFSNNGTYILEQIDVYPTESDAKLQALNSQLDKGDYLVLSSKRVYRSILLNEDLYPKTAAWYRDLFNGRTNYQLIKTFTSYPRIACGSFSYIVPDNIAPENFTIFDHPKVMIFKNIDKDENW